MRIAHALSEQATLPESAAHRWKSGIDSLDSALAGGLAYGRVHEVYAGEADDASAAAAFVVALATSMGDGNGSIVWLRSHRSIRRGGNLQANGWAELGGEAANALFGVLPDNMALLRAAVDALRCAALDAVIVEAWGRMSELDLTASRRLTLAAEKSGAPLFLLRVDAAPVTSAAQTRWQVASAPSRALAGQAPGWPTFDIELLRQKSGPSGLNWRLEWNRDRHEFRDASASGAMVPVPVRRPAADTGAGPLHHIARRAA